jgi:L,D-peptidoglycan transpeptidase YkuD (ErfK/YbiS/YcfS/YnhG family)
MTKRRIASSILFALMSMAFSACVSSNPVVQYREIVSIANINPKPSPLLVQDASVLKSTEKESYSLLIHRADKRLEILNNQGIPLDKTTIGIGKGGLKEKQDMADSVTPVGEMTVDLILYKKPEYDQIAKNNLERFAKDAQYRTLVTHQQGLAQLFNNMNQLDFDGNGSPDRAYGDGYIGLTSTTTITGPKMSTFAGTPYWFSIALHGTPQPENIGQANSGGCVHIDSNTLQQLIEKGWVKLGTKVTIVD